MSDDATQNISNQTFNELCSLSISEGETREQTLEKENAALRQQLEGANIYADQCDRARIEAEAKLAAAEAQVKELVDMCAQIYPVVGALADSSSTLGTEEVDRVLDNLSEACKVHEDFLPFHPQHTNSKQLAQVQRELDEAKGHVDCLEQLNTLQNFDKANLQARLTRLEAAVRYIAHPNKDKLRDAVNGGDILEIMQAITELFNHVLDKAAQALAGEQEQT